jgi:hypothetical protein
VNRYSFSPLVDAILNRFHLTSSWSKSTESHDVEYDCLPHVSSAFKLIKKHFVDAWRGLHGVLSNEAHLLLDLAPGP